MQAVGRAKTLLLLGAALVVVASGIVCSRPVPETPVSQGQPLWGDMKPIVSVKELMRDMIDPASDFIFDSVSTSVRKEGTIEHFPRTDEDWDRLRFGAVTIAEGVYLLKVPRPFAPAGDENSSSGPDAGELSPEAIETKVKSDPVQWNARIEALRNVGLEVLDIVKRRDTKELWDAGDNLDTACENCHVNYWYPNEKELFKKLDRRLQELFPTPPATNQHPAAPSH